MISLWLKSDTAHPHCALSSQTTLLGLCDTFTPPALHWNRNFIKVVQVNSPQPFWLWNQMDISCKDCDHMQSCAVTLREGRSVTPPALVTTITQNLSALHCGPLCWHLSNCHTTFRSCMLSAVRCYLGSLTFQLTMTVTVRHMHQCQQMLTWYICLIWSNPFVSGKNATQ